ncbi:uncharacterized protein LOC143277993 [Babylonia areolata]|uniref:uncharacterized protein LOC143277993 n=1 Tax=Babylonia areolata TaxID=304850 RepID=UPI003FD1FBA7
MLNTQPQSHANVPENDVNGRTGQNAVDGRTGQTLWTSHGEKMYTSPKGQRDCCLAVTAVDTNKDVGRSRRNAGRLRHYKLFVFRWKDHACEVPFGVCMIPRGMRDDDTKQTQSRQQQLEQGQFLLVCGQGQGFTGQTGIASPSPSERGQGSQEGQRTCTRMQTLSINTYFNSSNQQRTVSDITAGSSLHGHQNLHWAEAEQMFEKGKLLHPPLLDILCPESGVFTGEVFSWTNSIVLGFEPLTTSSKVNVSVTAVDKSSAVRLTVVRVSQAVGSISPPTEYSELFSACETITPPAGHMVLLTDHYYTATAYPKRNPLIFLGHCGQPLNKGRELAEGTVFFPSWFLNVTNLPLSTPAEHEGRGVPLSLVYSWRAQQFSEKSYFKLRFSFQRWAPQRAGQHWNCSKWVWPELYLHFACDLHVACVDAEDETHCSYYSEKCGLEKMAVEGKCFFFLSSDKKSTSGFLTARAKCQIASFDSVTQWDSVVNGITRAWEAGVVGTYIWVNLMPTRVTAISSGDVYIQSIYLSAWSWGTGNIAYNFHPSFNQSCITARINVLQYYLSQDSAQHVKVVRCPRVQAYKAIPLCEVEMEQKESQLKESIVLSTNTDSAAWPVPLVTCGAKHLTHVQLACDPHSLCNWRLERRNKVQTATCEASATQSTPYFQCGQTRQYVPYSVLCDWRTDCADHSDESFCQFPHCGSKELDCGEGQCIRRRYICDGMTHCKSKKDEVCAEPQLQPSLQVQYLNVTHPPAVVNFDRSGSFTLVPLPGNSSQCPETHYQCPGNGYCLPVYTRCNGIADCPGLWDETDCKTHRCEGLYRCRGKDREICLHVHYLCDGWPQCPQNDDELMCGMTETCPDRCVCYGTVLLPSIHLQADTSPKVRYLEGRGSGLTWDVIAPHVMLIYLGVGACGWKNMSAVALPNLHVFDVSDNLLQYISWNDFSQLCILKELDLSGNPLSSGISGLGVHQKKMESIFLLNLSRVSNPYSYLHAFSDTMQNIKIIDFSSSPLKDLKKVKLPRTLQTLNLDGCPISDFSPDFMKGMDELQQVWASNFKLCCPVVLPENYFGRCVAPDDEISSCDNLLKSASYRIALTIFVMTALLGNLFSFVYRLWYSAKRKVGHAVFVIHLCMSDFFMGVYLLIIGLADRVYAGSYLWNESSWKRSTVCRISGFVSLLSCEVSSFLICLITLDRFLVIRFPFSRLRFGVTSAIVACTVSWGLGMILASIPLLPVTSHWGFYSQTGICIPLPVTRTDFPGRHYSFGVMIVFNLILFLMIAAGQTLIYFLPTMGRYLNLMADFPDGVWKPGQKEFTRVSGTPSSCSSQVFRVRNYG